MAAITFKAKVKSVYNVDDTLAYKAIPIPAFGRHHCDMAAFRSHPKYGSYANSDLFPSILARIRKEKLGLVNAIRLDRVPDGVSIDASSFLAVVTLEV